MQNALKTTGGLAVKVDIFEVMVRIPLQHSLDYGRQNASAIFFANYAGRKVLQVLFGSVTNEGPKMIVLTFRAGNDGSVVADRKEMGGGEVFVFGESAEIVKYQRTHPEWNAAHPVEIIQKFLDLEIAAEPALVGPPKAIVRVTRNGATWIAGGLCSSLSLGASGRG